MRSYVCVLLSIFVFLAESCMLASSKGTDDVQHHVEHIAKLRMAVRRPHYYTNSSNSFPRQRCILRSIEHILIKQDPLIHWLSTRSRSFGPFLQFSDVSISHDLSSVSSTALSIVAAIYFRLSTLPCTNTASMMTLVHQLCDRKLRG